MAQRDTSDEGSPTSPRAGVTLPAPPFYRQRPREFYLLWLLALLTYGVGDVATTVLAVYTSPGLIESNPLLAAVFARFDLNGFLAIKLAVLLVLLWISVRGTRASDRFTYYWPPVAAALLGAGLTVWNGYLLVTAG